ncbi:MAG: hypothetical protein AB8F74_20880 [Saprospiraceae bacterium]
MPLCTDAQMAINSIERLTKQSKHLGIYTAYIRQCLSSFVTLHKINTGDNVSDMMTKQMDKKCFQKLRKYMYHGIILRFIVGNG